MTYKSLFTSNDDGGVTTDYAGMVSQIAAIEQGVKMLAKESRARRQQLQAGLGQEIFAMRESYLTWTRQRLEQV